MSYYLIDFTKKNFKFNFDNLIIGKKINTGQAYFKYYIYYNDNDVLSEIYIKLPKIRSIYNLSNYKFNSLNMPIYPTFDAITIFITFIKTLEKYIIDYFKKKKEFISLLSKKESLEFIRMNIDDETKMTSNTNTNKIVGIKDFKANSQLGIVLKFEYIWANKIKFGISSQIYQIKYYPPPEIDFIDSDNELEIINPIKKNPIIPIKKTSIQPAKIDIIKPVCNMRPSLHDINNALKTLKNIKK